MVIVPLNWPQPFSTALKAFIRFSCCQHHARQTLTHSNNMSQRKLFKGQNYDCCATASLSMRIVTNTLCLATSNGLLVWVKQTLRKQPQVRITSVSIVGLAGVSLK